MCSISKRIGDIRLSDFKILFDRPGFYRYHFKAVDQEFGMVKEEVSYNAMNLPKVINLRVCRTFYNLGFFILVIDTCFTFPHSDFYGRCYSSRSRWENCCLGGRRLRKRLDDTNQLLMCLVYYHIDLFESKLWHYIRTRTL